MEKNGSGLNEADVDRLLLADDSPQPKAIPPKPDFKSLAAGEREDHIQEKPQLLNPGEDLEGILFGRPAAAAEVKAHTTAGQLKLFPSDCEWPAAIQKIFRKGKD